MYKIEQQGDRWVASNGADHVEDVSAEQALCRLLIAEEGQAVGLEDIAGQVLAEELEDRLGASLLRLIRLTATRAPAQVLRGELTVAGKLLESFIGAAALEV